MLDPTTALQAKTVQLLTFLDRGRKTKVPLFLSSFLLGRCSRFPYEMALNM